VTPADLAEWTVRAKVLADTPDVASALLESARALREAINAAVVALGESDAGSTSALATIDRWLPAALVPDRLGADDDGLPVLTAGRPTDAGRHALGLIARDAAQMLGTDQRDRVRVCASETCSARFYDRSRAGRRRWCSMPGCGNVEKARRRPPCGGRRRRRMTPRAQPSRFYFGAMSPSRRLSYALLGGLAVRDYRADLDLTPGGGGHGTQLRWHTTFTAKVPGSGWLYLRALTKATQ